MDEPKIAGEEMIEPKETITPTRLQQIARGQRNVNRCILGMLLMIPLLYILSPTGTIGLGIGIVLFFLLTIVTAISALRFATVVYDSTSIGCWFCFGAFFCNILSLIILGIASQKATKLLKENGIKVGLLGADMSQFD